MTVQRIDQAPAALARAENALPGHEWHPQATRPTLAVAAPVRQRPTPQVNPAVAGLATPSTGGATSAVGRRIAVARLEALRDIAQTTLQDPAVDAEARVALESVFKAELEHAEAQVASFAV